MHQPEQRATFAEVYARAAMPTGNVVDANEQRSPSTEPSPSTPQSYDYLRGWYIDSDDNWHSESPSLDSLLWERGSNPESEPMAEIAFYEDLRSTIAQIIANDAEAMQTVLRIVGLNYVQAVLQVHHGPNAGAFVDTQEIAFSEAIRSTVAQTIATDAQAMQIVMHIVGADYVQSFLQVHL